MNSNFGLIYILILAFPLFLNIVLPLMLLSGWLIFQPLVLLYSRMTTIQPRVSVRGRGAGRKANKRVDRRISTTGLSAEVADGNGVYNGLVSNISRAGICLANLPERLSNPATRLSVIIRDKTEEYCFFLTPTWTERSSSAGRCIGGRLENVPAKWSTFVHSCQ